jgi:hypothetical protein
MLKKIKTAMLCGKVSALAKEACAGRQQDGVSIKHCIGEEPLRAGAGKEWHT